MRELDWGSPNIEHTTLKLLTEFEGKLSDSGITLWLAALNPEALQAVKTPVLGQRLTYDRMFFSLEQAAESLAAGQV
jgi:SulP family sulfate permease